MQYKSNEGKRLEAIAKRHPKQFWKSIKSCNKPNNSWNQNISIEYLHDHFSSLLGEIPDNTHDDAQLLNYNDDDLDKEIYIEEIRKAFFKQTNNKACGLDRNKVLNY